MYCGSLFVSVMGGTIESNPTFARSCGGAKLAASTRFLVASLLGMTISGVSEQVASYWASTLWKRCSHQTF